jgi:hypothetical protein
MTTDLRQQPALKSCPFCGWPARIEGRQSFVISCRNPDCWVGVATARLARDEAITAWNTRSPSPAAVDVEGVREEGRQRGLEEAASWFENQQGAHLAEDMAAAAIRALKTKKPEEPAGDRIARSYEEWTP